MNGMLAVTGSKHGYSYLQLVYRVVGVAVVYRNGVLAVTGSKQGYFCDRDFDFFMKTINRLFICCSKWHRLFTKGKIASPAEVGQQPKGTVYSLV